MAPKRSVPLAGPSRAGSSQHQPHQPPLVNRAEPKIALVTSKEWLVPPRPKPGRKPSKVDDSSVAESSTLRVIGADFAILQSSALSRSTLSTYPNISPPKGNTARISGKETGYIAELEQRVRALEGGEGVKDVFFQSQAVGAKDESAQLRNENEHLLKQVTDLQLKLGEAIHSHAPSPSSSTSSPSGSTRPSTATSASTSTTKRRHSTRTATVEEFQEEYMARLPKRSRQGSVVSTTSSSHEHSRTPLASISHIVHAADHDAPRVTDYPLEESCGFCSNEWYLCSQVSEYAAPTPVEGYSLAQGSYFPTAKHQLSRTGGAPVKSVWKLEPAPSSITPCDEEAPVCSGDSSNCPACADDPFGKALCESLSQSVCSTTSCANCFSRLQTTSDLKNRTSTSPPSVEELDAGETAALLDTFTDLPCCGQPSLCGSATCLPKEEQARAEAKQRSSDMIEMLYKSIPGGVRTKEIPCSEAWSVLKSHSNIAFTNLQMLVAKRTRCDGATFSPALKPIRSPDELVQRRRLTVERGAVDQALELLTQGSLRR